MKGKFIRTIIGVCFVLLVTALLFISPEPLNRVLSFFENGAYDIELQHTFKPVGKDVPVLIVDIDDESLKAEGHWPWPRSTLARLTDKLYQLGATVIAFDFTFPSADKNLVTELMEALQKKAPQASAAALTQLETIKPSFDFDAIFAKSLGSGNSILGFVFKTSGEKQGILPSPFLTVDLSEQLFIPDMKSYIANTPILQCAAKYGAFLNSTPDPDGVNRFAPVVLRMGDEVYSSLALEAVRIYLLTEKPELITASYGTSLVLEGIKLDQWVIPTDPWGRILIPFRGPAYSIPYVSAIDVLEDRAKKEEIADKLVFIGSSATATADLVVTAISPTFPGVEVHADIALGIIEHYLPYKPTWGKGISIGLVLILGLICAVIFPLLGPLKLSFLFFALSFALFSGNYWMWTQHGIVLSVIFTIFILAIVYLMNLIMGYLFESRQRRRMKSVFSQYLPKERIELLMQTKEEGFGLEGESKELTVLFADIRNFTGISESMTAAEIKQFLTQFFTPMTEIIFNHKGTIDKYVGDMIMAFWGAPLPDLKHPFNAVVAAWEMQAKLVELNQKLKQLQIPEIRIGIGVNTGSMSVGDMGSQFRRAYTVLGDSVNLASRLENLTKYYRVGIIVGEKTVEKTNQDFIYRKLDRAKVKGKEKTEYIYELIAPAEKMSQAVLENLKVHEKALNAYFAQDWQQAETLFQQLVSLDPSHEPLYKLFLDRIAVLRLSPTKTNWDGVFTFETKQ